MGEFVGKRIVPRHEGDWDNTRSYEPLMIVLDPESGDGYISRYDVPAGTALTNTHYWALCSHFNAQMHRLETDLDTDVAAMHRDLAETKQAMSTQVSEALTTVAQNLNQTQNRVEQQLAQTKTSMSQELAATHSEMREELDTAREAMAEELNSTKEELSVQTEKATAVTSDARAEMSKAVEQLTKRLDANVAAHTTANKDYAAEVVDARVDAYGETHANLGEYLRLTEKGACASKMTGLFLSRGGTVVVSHESYYGYCTEKIAYDASLGGIAVEADKLVYGNPYISSMAFYDKRGKFIGFLGEKSEFQMEGKMAIAVESSIPEGTGYFAVSTHSKAPTIWYYFTNAGIYEQQREVLSRLVDDARVEFDDQEQNTAKVIKDQSCTVNLINPDDEQNLYGRYYMSNGQLGSHEDYFATGFIPVVAGRAYTMKALLGGATNCIYDARFNVIGTFKNEITIPEDGRYVKLSVYYKNSNPMFYPTDTPPMGYEKFVPVGKIYQIVDSLREIVEQKLFGVVGKNLFNKDSDQIILQKYLANQGGVLGNTDYFISGYIPVEAGKSYFPNQFGAGGAYHCCYAADKTTVLACFKDEVITIPEGGAYLRMSGLIKNMGRQQLEEGTSATEYMPYTQYGFLDEVKESIIELEKTMSSLDDQGEEMNMALSECRKAISAMESKLEEVSGQDVESMLDEVRNTATELRNLAESIQREAGNVGAKLDKIIGKNLFDARNIIEGKYLMNNGGLGDNNDYFVSDFIPVEAGQQYTHQNFSLGGAYHCVFAEDKKTAVLAFQSGTVTIPENGRYVRLSGAKAHISKQQFEKGSEATEYAPFTEYAPAQENRIRIEKLESGMAGATGSELEVVLPSTLYLCKDVPLSFYLENILYKSLSDAADVYCNQGTPYPRILNLSQKEAGTTTAKFTVMRALKKIRTQSFEVVTSDPVFNNDSHYNMLFIGDSFTDIGSYVTETKKLLEADGAVVNLLGTCGSSSFKAEGLSGGSLANTFLNASAGVARIVKVKGVSVAPNTGYPGRTYQDDNGNKWTTRGWVLDENGDGKLVVTKFTAKDADFESFPESGTLTKVAGGGQGDEVIHYEGVERGYFNPFINPETGVLDITHYLSYWGFPNPDVVVFQFTWNDAGVWLQDDSRLVTNFINAVNHVHEHLPDASIILSIEPFGAINSTSDWNGKKYTVLNLVKHLCEVFETEQYSDFCKIAPSYACVDLVNGYGGGTVTPNKRYPNLTASNPGDGVHPGTGMLQIADCIYPVVTYLMSN